MATMDASISTTKGCMKFGRRSVGNNDMCMKWDYSTK